jgi:hypothetical protein
MLSDYAHVMPLSCCNNIHVLTQVAVKCMKQLPLKDKTGNYLTNLMGKGGKQIKI